MARTPAQIAAQKKAAAASAAARHKAGPGFDKKLRDRKKARKEELGTALLRSSVRKGPIAGGIHLGNTSTPSHGTAPMPKASNVAHVAKRAKLASARSANQADVAYQNANPGAPVTRLPGRQRYDKSGQLRVKGKVGSRLRKGK